MPRQIPEVNLGCGACTGLCGAVKLATPAQELTALRILSILYGSPLLVTMVSLMLVSSWSLQIPLWLEIITLVSGATLGYGFGLLYLRRHDL